MSKSQTLDALGEAAYDGYCRSSNYKSLISGAPLPLWHSLPTPVRQAWVASAEAVLKSHAARLY